MNRRPHNQAGSSTMLAMVVLSTLAFIGANAYFGLVQRYRSVHHPSSWQQALFAAEGGADYGLASMRSMIVAVNATGTNAFLQSNGWTTPVLAGGFDSQSNYYRLQCKLPTLAKTGEGGSKVWTTVEIDPVPKGVSWISSGSACYSYSPDYLQDEKGNQWYRIRAWGIAELPPMAGIDVEDQTKTNLSITHTLRKLSMRADRKTGEQIEVPRMTRMVEMIVRPLGPFYGALNADQIDTYPGPTGVVGSFDSTSDAWDSYIDSKTGRYDFSDMIQDWENGVNVPTSGDVVSRSSTLILSNGESWDIYGDVSTDGGTITADNQIHGEVNNNVTTTVPSVDAPSWSAYADYTQPRTTMPSIIVGSSSGVDNIKVSKITTSLTLKKNPSISGTTVINIWVTGDVDISKGNNQITVESGVTANFYVEGDIVGKARYFVNENANEGRSQTWNFYGIKPTDGSEPVIDIDSPGELFGTIYAPDHGVNTNGNPMFIGSVVCGRIFGNGTVQLIYDESLSGFLPFVTGYARASFVENAAY